MGESEKAMTLWSAAAHMPPLGHRIWRRMDRYRSAAGSGELSGARLSGFPDTLRRMGREWNRARVGEGGKG